MEKDQFLHARTGTMMREVRPYQETLKHLLLLADGIYRETQWWPDEISPGRGGIRKKRPEKLRFLIKTTMARHNIEKGHRF